MPDFSVVIPSAQADNLKGCVESVLSNEPDLAPSRVIVVDDGAKAGCGHGFPPVTWIPGIKPFVFARNANLGIRKAGTDVVLMNDDARLRTPGGFGLLASFMDSRRDVGVVSAAVDGFVGNPEQAPKGSGGFRPEGRVVAFVCVLVPQRVFGAVGPLDERFTAYGGDDMDYCDRVIGLGLAIGVHDGCVVSHGEVPSTFRTRPDAYALLQEGLRIYEEKRRTG